MLILKSRNGLIVKCVGDHLNAVFGDVFLSYEDQDLLVIRMFDDKADCGLKFLDTYVEIYVASISCYWSEAVVYYDDPDMLDIVVRSVRKVLKRDYAGCYNL